MAVYTQVSAEAMAAFLTRFDVGTLTSFKGIAEGVENSNYLLETTSGRYFLTLYEKRVDPGDLPFFLSLLDHLHDRDCKVPCAIPDRSGEQLHDLCGRKACLIEFLEGVSPTVPTPPQARAAGAAQAAMHHAVADFAGARPNTLTLPGWHDLADACGEEALASVHPELGHLVREELAFLDERWPADLPRSVIHADLFPDNVLMLGDTITGLIDFYFSCTDIRAYDLAVTHSAWCFAPDGHGFDAKVSAALIAGYRAGFVQSAAERAAMPVLARGAALRFLLTRAYDWVNTPAGAMVTRKDPMAFARRLIFYRDPQNAGVFEGV